MLFRALIVFAYALLLGVTVRAQDGAQLTYGETITGEFAGYNYEDTYTFQGERGDVVAIEMRSLDRSLLNPLIAPVLVLTDGLGDVLADTTATYPIHDTTLFAELPHPDTYTITATREGRAQGTSYGEYSLTVHRLEVLALDNTLQTSLDDPTVTRYYALKPDAAFGVAYTHDAGDYHPQVWVNRIIAEVGDLELIAEVGGPGLTRAYAGVFPGGETYILSLGETHDSFHPAGAQATITISPRREDG